MKEPANVTAAQILVVEQKLKGTKGNTAMACFEIKRMLLR